MEMYFRNESDKAPWPLVLPGCPHRCPLQDFLHLTEPVVPKDWQQECQLASGPVDTGELLPASVRNVPEQLSVPTHRSPKSCCPSNPLTLVARQFTSPPETIPHPLPPPHSQAMPSLLISLRKQGVRESVGSSSTSSSSSFFAGISHYLGPSSHGCSGSISCHFHRDLWGPSVSCFLGQSHLESVTKTVRAPSSCSRAPSLFPVKVESFA